MKKKNNYKKYRFTYIMTTLITLFICLLGVRGYTEYEETGENFYHVMLNGQEMGIVEDEEKAEELLIRARRKIASESDELVFIEAELSVQGEELLWGSADNDDEIVANMEKVLRGEVVETMQRSYTLKLNDYIINLASLEDVTQLLQAAIDKYDADDADDSFQVSLAYDGEREFSVLAASINKTERQEKEEKDYSKGGIASILEELRETEIRDEGELDFEDYEDGILSMNFSEKVEVVEAYLPAERLTSLEEAIQLVVMDQEIPGIYEIKQGDTLSEIAIEVNIPMDEIIAMNDSLENEYTTLQIGQQLIITIPEPILSVEWTEQMYVEETYNEEVIVIEEDSWYTTDIEVLQQPHDGFRKAIANISYVNGKEVAREILKEEVLMQAVPKIIKQGTKIPPRYIKPIKGGRLTSGFGPRKAPKKGASTNHKGVDWAVATGTSVYASCGGTVTKAGWASGTGYTVYIDHEDGKQTRYGHLSRILVSVGQKVKQGDRIALSGSTGNSTGPHLHFEIRVHGTPVNPFNYVPK
ncbi:MAG: M23 family metallopeptidase [Roseburia sp.]|nr:M23 family metallopeptidase [Roseburia sp.]MCM1099572.1 M23 family metallopeptidase [Ruminococcus flavefaciens]